MNKLAPDPVAIAAAFEAIASYDRGSSRAALMPIDDAVVASLGDVALRKDLEQRLATLLQAKISVVAKEYVCSKLRLIGTSASAPALGALLGDKDLAHAAQDALEAIPRPETVQTLREALPKLSGLQKVGAIDALADRRDAASVTALSSLLNDVDRQVAAAAAAALGEIGAVEAAEALHKADPTSPPIADALLTCAERLSAAGEKDAAAAIYKTLDDPRQPKHVRHAAALGASR